jgi:hypothetical protein
MVFAYPDFLRKLRAFIDEKLEIFDGQAQATMFALCSLLKTATLYDGWVKPCTVSTTDASGKRHTLEIEAKTLYSAILHFNAEAIYHPAYGLPKPTDDMIFDVEVDGKVYTRTFRHAMDWSNWKTDRDHAKLERLRRRD